MHPCIIYVRKPDSKTVEKEIKTQLAFTPELNTTIYTNGIRACVVMVVIDVDVKPYPAIIIHTIIK